jgi:hypothetical protein
MFLPWVDNNKPQEMPLTVFCTTFECFFSLCRLHFDTNQLINIEFHVLPLNQRSINYAFLLFVIHQRHAIFDFLTNSGQSKICISFIKPVTSIKFWFCFSGFHWHTAVGEICWRNMFRILLTTHFVILIFVSLVSLCNMLICLRKSRVCYRFSRNSE